MAILSYRGLAIVVVVSFTMIMEQLIPIASKLQDVLGALGQSASLDLPQIVVVGGQSSGKSSVLESLVGRSFLPRGTGIVTRRPLVLQLYNTRQDTLEDGDEDEEPDEVVDDREWGEFLHVPGKKYFDFAAIREEIVAETDRLTGKNKGIDSEPIHLKVFSPRVLALTLVDLPGIAKVPVGDQPDDIEAQIHDMCLSFISNPNAIVLAVTSANTDLANSDALKLAQSVDPGGHRTVGVLTKLDLMDEGTDCVDILTNQVIPLSKGYIAVVNRGQKDVMSDLSIRDGLTKEEVFFRNHPVYSKDRNILAKCGTKHLAKGLNTILMHNIRDCLPDLKSRITHMMNEVQQELESLGSPIQNASRSARGSVLLKMLSKFANNFANVLDGKGPQESTLSSRLGGSIHQHHGYAHMHELMGGARISFVFTEVFANSLIAVGAFDGLSDDEIRTTICNANGTRPALFVPEISFDILVRRQVARLEQPGVQCVDMVYEELQRIAAQSEPSEMTRFPLLRDRMVEVVMNLLKRCVGPTQMMVSNLVKIELAYINTSHPDFIGGSRAVARLMEKIGKENDRARHTNADAANATPLSPTSLNHYGYEDAIDHETMLHSPSGNTYDRRPSHAGPGAGPNHTTAGSNSGIMNLLFRGGTGAKPPRPASSSASVPGGPPSIVHLPQVQDSMKPTDLPPTERERVEMEVIKSLIESYFSIVRKNYIDLVPKTVMYFLVNHVRDSLQNELVSELYRDAEVGTLMQEAEDIASRRQTCIEMKDLLQKALEIVNEVRDFNAFK